MGLLNQLKNKYSVVSIIGMAKNAGKTTALNYILEEAMDEGMCLGVTSTGRDGESTDLVTGTEKPRVYLEQGTIVSVPKGLYDLADAGLEILRMTNYRTSLGRLMLCRVAESGYVQIAGPVATADQKKMCSEMKALGAEMIMIDGAVDRRSIAAPDASDAVILATGAVLSRNMKKVVQETAYVVSICSLPRLSHQRTRKLIEENRDKITLIADGRAKTLNLATGLGSGKFLQQEMSDETEYIYMPGAFTKSVIADMGNAELKKTHFVLKDPMKIFFDAVSWHQLMKKGTKVSVLENIKVAAVTVNPVSPAGYSFGHEDLREAVSKALPEIPVIDVRL